jgi:hypothetical protein
MPTVKMWISAGLFALAAAGLVVLAAGCEDGGGGYTADTDESPAPKAGGVGVVNAACPIMGTEIDPDDVPENLTREFRGKTVGFCCSGCPAAWDKLSDEEKEKKLAGAMAAAD